MDKDIFMFGDGGSKGSDIMAMIPALMQNEVRVHTLVLHQRRNHGDDSGADAEQGYGPEPRCGPDER